MNLLTAKNKTKKLIDEYSTRGNLNTDSDINIVDYSLKMNDYFDIAQKEIAAVKAIRKVNKFAHGIPTNNLQSGFRSHIKEGEPLEFKAIGRAYYFEVVGDVDITISCGTETEHIDNFSTDFAVYKGAFDTADEMTISFAGNYMYTVRNIAIFAVPTPYAYAENIRYNLPDDCYKVIRVEMDSKPLIERFYFYRGNSLFISSKIRGEIIMEYAAMPQTIDDNTSDYYEFEIAEELQGAMCFYVAALLLQSENPSMYSILYSQYQNKLANADTVRLPMPNRIKRAVR